MAPMHGPTYGPLFHSWPWRIPFMAMAPFHLWPRPPFMAKALSLSLSHYITSPGKPSPYIRCRMPGRVTNVDFARRSNPGIKSYSRWGWFRGVAAVDRGDHGISYIRICIGHKWGYARIYGGKNGHIYAYLWAMYAHIYGSSNGHVNARIYGPCIRISMAAVMAMNARIYGPCIRISMAAVMAMNARIYGSSNGHVCAYLWGQQ